MVEGASSRTLRSASLMSISSIVANLVGGAEVTYTRVNMLNMGYKVTFALPVFTIAPLRIKYLALFSDVTRCGLVNIFKYFGGTLCFQIRCRYSRFLRNFCNFSQTVRGHVTGDIYLLNVMINWNNTNTRKLTDMSSYHSIWIAITYTLLRHNFSTNNTGNSVVAKNLVRATSFYFL
jgi:hypothetical protein